jgi:hypothetical protein
MAEKQEQFEQEPIVFELSPEQAKAVEILAANRKIRLSGQVRDGKFIVDNMSFADRDFSNPLFVAVNAPFKTT